MPTFELTDKQAAVRDVLKGPERHNLIYGGSRSGKTFLLCYVLAVRGLSAPRSRQLIARLHNIDVRQSIMLDTWPKMMALAFPGVPYTVNKSDQFVMLPGGSEVWMGGLDDKDRVDKILGKEFAGIYVNEASQVAYESILTLRTRLAQSCSKSDGRPLKQKFYADLNPVGRGHWTYKEFVEGVRPENGLPITPGTRAYAVMNPADNPHLSAEYKEELDALPERQRKRFMLGEYLTEVPGALWPLDLIESLRVDKAEAPDIKRIVVAVDPSGSDGAGGSMQGIVAVGLGSDGHGYVLRDASCRLSPEGWARRAVDLYHELDADLIVAEENFGGKMVQATIRTADPNVPYKSVTASRGKHIRAEPVSALYEQGKAHHLSDPDHPKQFAALEEQMGMMTTDGFQGTGSPDRVDALVWAFTELMVKKQHKVPIPGAPIVYTRPKGLSDYR